MSSDIVVVGSLNMDMVVNVNRRPERGETLLGEGFFMSPGGKGANQAYAAGKLGGSVAMIGLVGDDLFADQLVKNLSDVGVVTQYIQKVSGQSSGTALITIDKDGDNSIIVAPGANQHITAKYIRECEHVIKDAKLLMVQLEIPLEAVIEAVNIAYKHRIPVLLDPAPAQPLPDSLLGKIDYILPNESEIAQLTGIQVHDEKSAKDAGQYLLDKGVHTVVSKLGGQGVVLIEPLESLRFEGFKVDAVDTTAAGDAFAGAFATALVSGKDLGEVIHFANAVGAITVTKPGAQSSMPDLEELETFIADYSRNKGSK